VWVERDFNCERYNGDPYMRHAARITYAILIPLRAEFEFNYREREKARERERDRGREREKKGERRIKK